MAVVLHPGDGRVYDMGCMRAVFLVDRAETEQRASVSEWGLEPRHAGPGAHKHDINDEIFYSLEGVADVRVGDLWRRRGKGGFALMPCGTLHDVRNDADSRMGLLSVYLTGSLRADVARHHGVAPAASARADRRPCRHLTQDGLPGRAGKGFCGATGFGAGSAVY